MLTSDTSIALKEAEAKLALCQAESEQVKSELDLVAKDLVASQGRRDELDREKAVLGQEKDTAQDRIAELSAAAVEARTDLAASSGHVGSLQREIVSLEKSLVAKEVEVEEAIDKVTRLEASLQEVSGFHDAANEALEETKTALKASQEARGVSPRGCLIVGVS